MRHRIHTWLALNLCLGTACSLAALPAWSQVHAPAAGIFVARTGMGGCPHLSPEVVHMHGAHHGPEKAGAPYSAVGITDVVNTLADGNRITRQNTMRYFRDSRGRTRTEFELAAIGPVSLGGKRTAVTINDPVANSRYILHPEVKQAMVIDTSAAGAATAGGPNRVVIKTAALHDVVVLHEGLMNRFDKADCAAHGKSPASPIALGERIIDGFTAVGSRLEVKIPAGEIGNELPMTITTEQWFSPELGVVLSSTHHDPMSGDTTYRLTQVSRAEPDANLFVVPADYTRSPVGLSHKFDAKRPAPAARPREQ